MQNLPWALSEILPHDAPMILIDEIEDFGPDHLVTRVSIAEDTPFCASKEGVPAWVGIEYMAQSVAAHAGVLALKRGDPVKIGFLLGTRRYDCEVPYFALGEKLTVKVCREYENQRMGVFQGTITEFSGAIVAKAAINVYEPDDPLVMINQGSA